MMLDYGLVRPGELVVGNDFAHSGLRGDQRRCDRYYPC